MKNGDFLSQVSSSSSAVFIVEGLIGENRMSIWASPPGEGKSLLAEALCYHVAYGAPFLGMNVKAGPVMIIDSENRKAVIGIAAIVGKLVLGPVSDIIGRIKVMMLCAALVAAGCLGIAYSERLLTLILFIITFGLGYGAIWSMYAASASDFFSKESGVLLLDYGYCISG